MDVQQHVPAHSPRNTPRSLTEREVEILQLAGKGLSRKGIAQTLGISAGTVGWHLKNAYQKLYVGSREEALRKARDAKLIEPPAVCHVCAGLLHSARWAPTDSSSH